MARATSADRRPAAGNDRVDGRRRTVRNPTKTAIPADGVSLASQGPRRTAKSENTRNRLIVAARSVFESKGYYETRVADIVVEAGVSHGTFYTHFIDKSDAFKAVVLASNDELNQDMLTVPAEFAHDLPSALDYSNRRFFMMFQRHAALHRAIAEATVFDPEFRELRIAAREEHIVQAARTIARWQERGEADTSLDAHHTAAGLVCMMAEFAYLAFSWERDYDLEQMTATANAMWLRTVGAKSSARRRKR